MDHGGRLERDGKGWCCDEDEGELISCSVWKHRKLQIHTRSTGKAHYHYVQVGQRPDTPADIENATGLNVVCTATCVKSLVINMMGCQASSRKWTLKNSYIVMRWQSIRMRLAWSVLSWPGSDRVRPQPTIKWLDFDWWVRKSRVHGNFYIRYYDHHVTRVSQPHHNVSYCANSNRYKSHVIYKISIHTNWNLQVDIINILLTQAPGQQL